MIPQVNLTKTDGNTGNVVPSSRGICAIIAPCSSGTANAPTSVSKPSLALSAFGQGILTEYASYIMADAGKPVVLVKGTADTAGTYSAITFTGTGTSVLTADSTAPYDDFNVTITVVAGGTIGVAGITYTYSLDGLITSAVTALGTATTITLPGSGVGVDLAAGTLVAGDKATFTTTGPRMTLANVSTALEALRTSGLDWEAVIVGGHDAAAATVTAIDAWLALREAEGRFRFFVINTREKAVAESEATFIASITTAFAAASSIRGCVGTEGGDVVSVVPGRAYTFRRPTALALAARLMKIDYGRDAAYVNDGPVRGFALADLQGNPKNHDESYYPGLDAQRLTTLRTFDRKTGTFITNPNTIAPAGSDYVYAQHIRVSNRACEIAYDILTGQLSRGVHKNPKPGPLGEIYIDEADALEIEALVNHGLNELRGQVTDLKFILSRLDDIGATGPIVLHGDVQISALAYVKGYQVNVSFVRTIAVTQ